LRGSLAYAADYSVFVGYADNLRANPVNFPTPFAGDPGVTFLGCTPATNGGSPCSFDGGVVRIVNNTAGSITISSVAVNIDTCMFTLWSSSLPVTIGFGGQLIVAQTASGASNGCPSPPRRDYGYLGHRPRWCRVGRKLFAEQCYPNRGR